MNSFVVHSESDRSQTRSRIGFSEETRAARFARWEQIGVELVRADLRNGGRFVVGGGPQTRALAEDWLRLKDAERTKWANVPERSGWERGRALLKKLWTDVAGRLERAFQGALHQH